MNKLHTPQTTKKMKKFQLIFVPTPGLSHLVSTVEAAKLLLDRDERLSITVLILNLPKDRVGNGKNNHLTITSNTDTNSRLLFMNIPYQEETSSPPNIFDFIDNQFDGVRSIVSNIIKQSSADTHQVAGLVLDMFCTKFIDVGQEFGIPSYIFFTSGACTLGVFCYLASLRIEHNQELTQHNSDVELSIPCSSIPVPVKVLPATLVNGSSVADTFLNKFSRFKETKGIMVNTFYELEPYAVQSLFDGKIETPKVYPIGPILNLSNQKDRHDSSSSNQSDSGDEIKNWLDNQPESSVVFLCFGSMGGFLEAQVKEIASALERSKHHFLWSLRKPGPKGTFQYPTEYEDFEEVLPEGFLERTEGIGKVIGWAPQVTVLSHPAVGGFVSHCGWNSTLESLWCGVPVATFPLYAEQQLNAFEFVKELGLAEAIRIDFNINFSGERDDQEIVRANEIEAAIQRLMADDGSGGVRHKVKEMQKKSKMALLEGGSSYNALNLFFEDVIKNIPQELI